MNRTTSTNLLATMQLGLVLVGLPVWTLARLAQPIAPFQSTDPVLLIGIAAWGLIVNALLQRNAAIDPLRATRRTPTGEVRRLVDLSLFGARAAKDSESTLHSIRQPLTALDALLPEPIVTELAEPAAEPLIVTTDAAIAEVDEVDEILATEEYVVGRGDTFWSLAEAVLDDGRAWTTIQRLNLGREVAPGIVLSDTDELRIGWSVLIPLVPAEALDGDHV